MTETFTALYLKVCPYLYCFTDCPAMVTDTNMPARWYTVTIGEVISRHHLLQVYHTQVVYAQLDSRMGMVCVHPFVPSPTIPFLS